MSRNKAAMNDNINIVYGSDHAIGRFVQVSDSRYAQSGQDEQGEGYVFEWDELSGITKNLINAKVEDIDDYTRLQELTDEFCKEFK